MRKRMQPETRHQRAVALVLWACLALCPTGHAGAEPAPACDPVMDLASGVQPRLLKIVPGSNREHFYKDDGDQPGCPRLDRSCVARPYLVPGDVVIATETHGEFVCAAFTTGKTAIVTSGWLRRGAVEDVPAAKPAALKAWLGAWRAGEWHEIKIAPAKDGAMALDGTAHYGAEDPARRQRGAVNIGELSVTVVPDGGTAAFSVDVEGESQPYDADQADDTRCRVRLWQLGPYLAVADNMNCGGFNVTFTGLYRRRGGE